MKYILAFQRNIEYKILLSLFKLKKKKKNIQVQRFISGMCWKCSAWICSYLKLRGRGKLKEHLTRNFIPMKFNKLLAEKRREGLPFSESVTIYM